MLGIGDPPTADDDSQPKPHRDRGLQPCDTVQPAQAAARVEPQGVQAAQAPLEFDDWYQLLGQMEALGLVSASAVSSSDALSQALAELPEGGWDESALARHPMWAQIRHFAGLALVELVRSSPEPRATYVRAAS